MMAATPARRRSVDDIPLFTEPANALEHPLAKRCEPNCPPEIAAAYAGKPQVTGAKPNSDPLADCSRWNDALVLVSGDKPHYRVLDTGEKIGLATVNDALTKYIPPDEKGRKLPAKTYLQQCCDIPRVVASLYYPPGGRLFQLDGKQFANEFRPSTIPAAKPKSEWTSEDAEAVETIKQHIDLLCGGRPEVAQHLFRWFAHNVQKLGVKIKHVPLIVGRQGDGKTLLSDMMGCVLGSANCKVTELKSTNFNNWATGAALCTLEEISITGTERDARYNALKAPITNDIIEIQFKGADCVNVMNTTNYLAFSNKVDALPLEQGDRRWFVIFTPWGKDAQAMQDTFQRVVGMVPDDWFAKVANAFRNHASAIRQNFLDADLSNFNRHAPAPETDEKRTMRQSSIYGLEAAVIAILEAKPKGVTDNVLSLAALRQEVGLYEGQETSGQRIAAQLLNLNQGWKRWESAFKWHGQVVAIYGRGEQMSGEAIRKVLDAS